MKCPYCGKENSRVIDSRPTEEGAIRRRRQCDECGKRFTTYENVETIPLIVVKKDGKREPFDRKKILAGIVRACYKRPVAAVEMEKVVDEIETNVYNLGDKEVSTTQIGELVMDKLKDIDAVAYVRFASVYREFKDVNTFMAELKQFLK
ncbi:MAG: transcriptional regulator NrdR [Lachnospiraceae bacterium]